VAVRDTKTPRVPFACTQGNYVTHSKNVSNASSCMSVDCKSDRKISSIKPPRLGDFRLLPLQEKEKSYFVGEVLLSIGRGYRASRRSTDVIFFRTLLSHLCFKLCLGYVAHSSSLLSLQGQSLEQQGSEAIDRGLISSMWQYYGYCLEL